MSPLFWARPGWTGRLWGWPWGCSTGRCGGRRHPQRTPSLPQKPWGGPSPGRPSARGLGEGLWPCSVSGTLPAAGWGPGQPGVAAAGGRRPGCGSGSGRQLEAPGWKRHSAGGWRSSRRPSHSWPQGRQSGRPSCGERGDTVRHCPRHQSPRSRRAGSGALARGAWANPCPARRCQDGHMQTWVAVLCAFDVLDKRG